jgi:hypothetical protein
MIGGEFRKHEMSYIAFYLMLVSSMYQKLKFFFVIDTRKSTIMRGEGNDNGEYKRRMNY